MRNAPGHDWGFTQWFFAWDRPKLWPVKLELNQPFMQPFEPAKDLKVVVACESSKAAGRVCAVLEVIGRNCEMEGRLIYSWWNFDGLTVAALRKLAAMEAAAANIIVIAAHDQEELPEEVINWLNQCLAMTEFHPRALVALLDLDTANKKVSQVIISQLKKVAEWGQMDFFANGTEGELEAALSEGLVLPLGNSS